MKFPTLLSGMVLAAGFTFAQCDDEPVACNGFVEFCDRKYSNVSLVGAHDSAFVGNITDPRVDQEINITGQLNAGIRAFEAQTHEQLGVLSMCHSYCVLLYAGSLHDYLLPIKTWLDANPNEVLTLFFSNGDNNNASEFASVYAEVGLDAYGFVPSTSPNTLPRDSWPTYQELIDSGKRFITFLDSKANETEVPYLLTSNNYFWGTPYDYTDPSFNQCTVAYPTGADTSKMMYVMNHFLDTNLANTGILIPDNDADYTTNAATGNGSIGAQADLCEQTYGLVPNVVLVDMYDRGDVFTAQRNLNGL